MSFYDPKTAYSILMGLAGAIHRIARLEQAVNHLLGEASDPDELGLRPSPEDRPRGQFDHLESLLVLATELEARGRKLALRSRALQDLRRKPSRHSEQRHVSRETRNRESEDEAPDTQRQEAEV